MPGSAILQGPAGTDPDRETRQGTAAIATSQSTACTAEGISGTRVQDVVTWSGHRGTPLPHPSASHVQPARCPGALRSRALARTPDSA